MHTPWHFIVEAPTVGHLQVLHVLCFSATANPGQPQVKMAGLCAFLKVRPAANSQIGLVTGGLALT
eukprot:s1055_g10.t1